MSKLSIDQSSTGVAPAPPTTGEFGAPLPRALYQPQLEGNVALWWCALEQPNPAIALLTSMLSSAERDRAARFGTTALRERYITGRAILRQLLGNALGMPAADVPIVRARRGRPMIDRAESIDFNVSHTRGIGVFALGTGLSPNMRVGIDVEHAQREARVDRLAGKLLTQSEQEILMRLSEHDRHQRFIRIWTCKEAMSKATGDGLAAPFRAIAVEPDEPPRVVDGPHPYTPDRWQLHRVPMPVNFVVTVALWQSMKESYE